ncbi:MAG: AMP-binding protein, partial [Dongiaceae bacterium]
MPSPNQEKPLWQPDSATLAGCAMARFQMLAGVKAGRPLNNYAALHQWSIESSASFWDLVWDFSGVIGEKGKIILKDGQMMPGAKWFPDAKLNFAENLLRPAEKNPEPLIYFQGEDKLELSFTKEQMIQEVAALAAHLKKLGVKPGDRIAAYIPNLPHAVMGMLAASSMGAVWSSCSPDFGVQ